APQDSLNIGPTTSRPRATGNSAGNRGSTRCAARTGSGGNSSSPAVPSAIAAISASRSTRRLTPTTPPTPLSAKPKPICRPGSGNAAPSSTRNDGLPCPLSRASPNAVAVATGSEALSTPDSRLKSPLRSSRPRSRTGGSGASMSTLSGICPAAKRSRSSPGTALMARSPDRLRHVAVRPRGALRHLEVQMRPRGVARAADLADALPGLDLLTRPHLALGQVAVGVDVPVVGAQPDPLAVRPALAVGPGDRSAAHGEDRGAAGSAEVHPGVPAPPVRLPRIRTGGVELAGDPAAGHGRGHVPLAAAAAPPGAGRRGALAVHTEA